MAAPKSYKKNNSGNNSNCNIVVVSDEILIMCEGLNCFIYSS